MAKPWSVHMGWSYAKSSKAGVAPVHFAKHLPLPQHRRGVYRLFFKPTADGSQRQGFDAVQELGLDLAVLNYL